MIYQLSHFIKDKFPFVWRVVEFLNSLLFYLFYRRKLSSIDKVLECYQQEYIVRLASLNDVDALVLFFEKQPIEAFRFFNPHSFDAKTISRLIKSKAYLFFVVLKEKQIVGYFFLRCFFNGKCFRGKIVDYRWRNRGIAKLMGKVSTDVAVHLGLRIFGTISKDNVASMASSSAVNEIKIIEYLPNDFVYIEYLPKK